MTSKIFKYICPCCNEEQDKAIDWQACWQGSTYALNRQRVIDTNITGGEHEDWSCPHCNEELPKEICIKIEKHLGWIK